MMSSRAVRPVALVRADISGDHIASIIKVTRIGEIGTTLAVTSNRTRCENLESSVRLIHRPRSPTECV
jgi:hypothetical protein